MSNISNWLEELENIISDSNNKQLKSIISSNPDIVKNFFSVSKIFNEEYKRKNTPQEAISDLLYFTKLSKLSIAFNVNIDSQKDKELSNFTLKIYNYDKKISISELIPPIENLGFKIMEIKNTSLAINQNIAEILSLKGENQELHIYKFYITPIFKLQERNTDILKQNIETILTKIAEKQLISDIFNSLVLINGFDWRKIKLLKAITRYLHQTNFTYDKDYVQSALLKHTLFIELLEQLFEIKFNPFLTFEDKNSKSRQEQMEELNKKIEDYLDRITIGSEDKVLRCLWEIIKAMVRTNYFQKNNFNKNEEFKEYISFKIDSSKISWLALPLPLYEIYVYSANFEAIHLRGGKVSRGGLRWSDRGEDYRTEILGLMKAQMTKNAVIVPVGAKGGFFISLKKEDYSPEEYLEQVINCYKNFLRALLDITDNIKENIVFHPDKTIIYDEPDPYLVVAADKGTASFSDYANSVAKEYDFWLQDAFASGGSAGYDHKKMAITAKGAFISTSHHFANMNINLAHNVIKVVGIGDMSGDVFGNGLLLLNNVQLIAAFDHRHIFLDPNPDPKISFLERERLFNLANSKWSDYSEKLISQGGGVFARNVKSIRLSPEVKTALDISPAVNYCTPEELIKAILRAPVDLIWNGGIGTYVKATTENNTEIGDKTNDCLRVNGSELRAKIVAEGGNLGFSQRGRIEYAQIAKGKINTDFIDNSGGVGCSDREVNLKIALNNAVRSSKLTIEQRNKILHDIKNEVEELVLADNYYQNQALTILESKFFTTEAFSYFIDELEKRNILNTNIEFLPNKTELKRKAEKGENLTRPELAVILSYSKIEFYKNLISSNDLANEEYFTPYFLEYFPKYMRENFTSEILSHPLRNEITANLLTNKLVNRLTGLTIRMIRHETNAEVKDIAKIFLFVSEILNIDNLWQNIEKSTINFELKIKLFADLIKITRRGIIWFLRNNLTLRSTESFSMQDFALIKQDLPNLLIKINPKIFDILNNQQNKDKIIAEYKIYEQAGIGQDLIDKIITVNYSITGLDLIYIAKKIIWLDISILVELYFFIGEEFKLDWLRCLCDSFRAESYWRDIAGQTLKSDFFEKQKKLLIILLKTYHNKMKKDINKTDSAKEQLELIKNFYFTNGKKERILQVFFDYLDEITQQENISYDMLIIANKKLDNLLQRLS